MKTRYLFLIIGLVSFLIPGCQTEIDMKLKEEDLKVVVNGIISPGQPVEVFVSWSLPLNGSKEDFRLISDAVVEVWEDNQYLDNLPFSQATFSYRDEGVVPRPGALYTVKVITSHQDPVVISTTIPHQVPVDTIIAWKKPDSDGDEIITFDITFTDTPGEKNYYLVQVVDGEMILSLYAVNIYQDKFRDIPGSVSFDGIPLTDSGFDGEKLSTRCYFYYNSDYHGPDIQIRLVSLSEELYRYLSSYQKYRLSLSEPYIEPVALYSSAVNGIGVLGGYHYSVWGGGVVK